MKRFFLSLLAIFFPWIVVLIGGNSIGAFANLALQLTFIGWIPASIWGFKVVKRLCLPKKELDGSENLDKIQEADVDSKMEEPVADSTEEKPVAQNKDNQ